MQCFLLWNILLVPRLVSTKPIRMRWSTESMDPWISLVWDVFVVLNREEILNACNGKTGAYRLYSVMHTDVYNYFLLTSAVSSESSVVCSTIVWRKAPMSDGPTLLGQRERNTAKLCISHHKSMLPWTIEGLLKGSLMSVTHLPDLPDLPSCARVRLGWFFGRLPWVASPLESAVPWFLRRFDGLVWDKNLRKCQWKAQLLKQASKQRLLGCLVEDLQVLRGPYHLEVFWRPWKKKFSSEPTHGILT